ncbi:HD domain-containing phosphohydrolase [Alloalcanivorax mobilis]|uniref:HD domain-containing phosphohydrolase n=1 Tax=Alloalcanivorax mobilis TaxID=2019569 RepID=UPI000C768BB9|nr:HD domain-containing phosphohydrolase [Alloalcanivorax mobilis]
MGAQEESYARVYHAGRIEQLMEVLCRPGGASLLLERQGAQPLPVVVRSMHQGRSLTLDISAIPEVAPALSRGVGFRLLGSSHSGMLRTPVMILKHTGRPADLLHSECDYPLYLEEMQRRDTFRAALRLGMEVGVVLSRDGDADGVYGDLKDLSLQGCLVELSAHAVALLEPGGPSLEMQLCFPDGSRLVLFGRARHHRAEPDRGVILAGFQFEPHSTEVDRLLWFYVREIEREAARHAEGGNPMLRPSALFLANDPLGNPVSRRAGDSYATPMARRLARSAGYLDTQILELRGGGRIDRSALSRHAERIMALHDEDREGVLFAAECLHHEPPMVRHGLAVAVRLLDLAQAQRMPREVCKAITAAALVHDLGKALLAPELLGAERLDASAYREVQRHVGLLQARLQECRWLSPAVAEAVIGAINERLDGSGYPQQRSADQLPELARLAAVVDVIDAMGRPRADRAPWPMDRIYRHMLDSPDCFDGRWVKRYIEHFGLYPVGTRIAFPGGEQGWVCALDTQGRPHEVWITDHGDPPQAGQGKRLHGAALAALGEARCVEFGAGR